MVIIEFDESDLSLFEDFINQYPDNTIISSSKKFIGGKTYELLIVLTPAIISSISMVIQNLINYKQEQYIADKNNVSELKVRVKKKDNEYEIVLKSSSIMDKDDLDELLNDTMKKICKDVNIDDE